MLIKKDPLAFILKLMGSLILFAMLFFISLITSNDEYTNLLIFLAALSSIFQAFNVIDFYFQSKVLSKYVVFSSIFMLILSSIVKIILIINKFSLIYFVFVMLLDSLILAICLIYFFKINGGEILKWSFDLKTSKKLLKSSWPLILSGLVIGVYMKIDQVMIKEILGVYYVGQYAAAVKLSEALYFLPVIITKSLFPAIIKSKQLSNEVYTNRMQSLYFLLTRFSLAIAIIVSILSPFIIETLYGIDYNEAVNVLIIHVWSLIFVSIGVIYNSWLINEGYTKKTFPRALLGMTVNIVLNYLLIPTYGIEGAAIASLIGYICADIIYDFFDKDVKQALRLKIKAILIINITKEKK